MVGESAQGSYSWDWGESLRRAVTWHLYSKEISPQAISGHVIATETGQSVSGAKIDVYEYSSLAPGKSWVRRGGATTDGNGNYVTTSLPAGDYGVRVYATGYATEWYQDTYNIFEADPVSVTAGATQVVDFSLEAGGTISGHVVATGTDPATGIQGARIDVYEYSSLAPGKSWVSYGWATTDGNGNYVTTGLPTGEYGVRVRATGYATEWYQDTYFWGEAIPVSVTAPGDEPGIDFSLEPGGFISGRVTYLVDGTPTPLANLNVTPEDSVTNLSLGGVRTDSGGYYKLDGLPEGSYLVRANALWSGLPYIDEWYDNAYQRDQATAVSVTPPGDTSGIDFTLDALERRDTIEQAIADGIAWLAAQQNADGSWGTEYPLAKTGLAVLKLETHAVDLGFSSPFDSAYEYHAQVEAGLNYIFSKAYITGISMQPAGNPDFDGDGKGVYFYIAGEVHDTTSLMIYNTSIAMMAIAASNSPVRVVAVAGSAVNGWSYRDVLRDAVDYLAWAQTDGGFGRGGWNYTPMNNAAGRSDQSNSGWATLALAHAQSPPPVGFSLPIPGFVKSELDVWINYIQTEDGGADYDGPVGANELWVNILKTGSLLQQMAFVGDTAATPRVADAIAYLVAHWGENYDPGWRGSPTCYHSTFTTMKGLEAFEIATIDSIDWFQELADAILGEQSAAGWWLSSRWDTGDRILSTEWALLTLQKVKALPPPPPPPTAEAGGPYLVEVGVSLTLDGSGSYHPEGRDIVDWYWMFGDGKTGSGQKVPHIYNTPGLYTAELTVTDSMGAIGTDTTMVVVYDPDAGFATGGGWFIPTKVKGDILPGIDDKSPAEFGFVVKYQPGATTPDGQLEFQYRQGNFNLHSSGMEWLVIVNNNWAKFRGTATIKGMEGLYRFRVDARDGDFGGGTQTDYFIIKVWAPSADPDKDNPVYKAEGDLKGGSIVIHAKKVTTLRLQSWFTSTDPVMPLLQNFAQAVQERSGGSVKIELYPGNALVPNEELANAVKQGKVEMGLIPSGQLALLRPVVNGGLLPFLYNDDDGLMAAVQAGIGALMTEGLKADNITAINWVDLGLSHLFSRIKMLALPSDVAGLKVRAALGIQAEAITQWGGTPVTMAMSDVYAALQSGSIAGGAGSVRIYDSYKLHEVARYFCVDNAFAGLGGLSINSDVWKSLDTKVRNIISDAAAAYATQMLPMVKQLDEQALITIRGLGVNVRTLTPAERAIWRQTSQPVWQRWVQNVGPVGQQIIDIALAHNPLP